MGVVSEAGSLQPELKNPASSIEELPSLPPRPEDPLALVARLATLNEPTFEAQSEQPQDLLHARKLNEFVYCPRLAYLEFARQEWQENADTLEGSFVHRRVDAGSGKLPDHPDEAGPPQKVRSIRMSAPGEGILAVIDLVEVEGERAVPIEYKRGRPPNNEHRAWDPERVQLCAQALILRENGWKCDYGVLYFAESRTRVEIPFDGELIELTRRSIKQAREVLFGQTIPPPLVSSPKCPRCSLVEICLPEEVNFLAGRLEGEIRRLVPPRADATPLYVQEHGMSIGLSGQCLQIKDKGEKLGEVRLIDTSQVCVRGNVQVSTQAIRELADRGIPVCYLSSEGRLRAMTTGMTHKNVQLRQSQFHTAFDQARSLILAREFVWAKVRNTRTLLRRNARDLDPAVLDELKRWAAAARRCRTIDALFGVEGMAARVYFAHFVRMLKRPDPGLLGCGFEGRNRRPPTDPVNALLSFVYSLMTKDFTVAALSIGLDPHQGFYHQPRYGRPSLALDLMEEFRPLVGDSTVLTLINNGIVDSDNFSSSGGAVSLTQAGRRAVIKAYERRMESPILHPVFGYKLNYRRLILVQVRLLGRYLEGEIERYPAFVTR